MILFGVAVCLTGILIAGLAGVSKEREMTEEQKKENIKEFNFWRGILVATFSGIMSACFAYGLAAGDPIKAIALRHGSPVLWQGLPVLVVVLLGGFTTNFVWCLILHKQNRSGREYITSTRSASPVVRIPMGETTFFGAGRPDLVPAVLLLQHGRDPDGDTTAFPAGRCTWPASSFSALSGGLPCTNGEAPSGKTRALITAGLAMLVLSTLIVGYGNYLAAGL